jgi:transcriptional regulator with XRE-family HTH domain
MKLGQTIQDIRDRENLTQEQFGELFHVTRQTVSNWENEKSYPDLITLIEISDRFDVSLDTMLKGDKKMTEKLNKNIRGAKKLRIALAAMALVAVLLGVGYYLSFVPEKYIPLEDTGLRFSDEGELYVDNPYGAFHGVYEGEDKDGNQIEIFFLSSTLASRTWEKPIKGYIWDFGVSDGEMMDDDGVMKPIPPASKVYYLPEKYVIESDLLADRHKHPTLFPIEMSEQECNERLEQIVKDSELVWEKK